MEFDMSTLMIAVFTASACAVAGVLLVLGKMSMMSDAISHTVLLGIVIAYMFVRDLSSPVLIIGAAAMGVLTVYMVETLVKTKKASEDAATGAVFPLLFSIAIIIISLDFRGVHLDTDSVLLGNLEFAALDRLVVGGQDIGPKALYVVGVVLLLNIIFFTVFYKELKVTTFDAALAAALGIAPAILHYALMSLVSLTAVSAFDAAGAILVIALMVGPAVTALLVTKSLVKTVLAAVGIGIFNSSLGYYIAYYFDLKIGGVIAGVTLAVFLTVLFFEPKKGIAATIIKRAFLAREFTLIVLIAHIKNHQTTEKAVKVSTACSISRDFNWNRKTCGVYIDKAISKGYIKKQEDMLFLTETGERYIQRKNIQYELD